MVRLVWKETSNKSEKKLTAKRYQSETNDTTDKR